MIDILGEYTLNDKIKLKNRVVMAPLTRCFAGPGFVPTDEMARYYAKRSSVGLIISEATVIDPSGHGYPDTPGIYTPEQIEGWKKVTAAVHQANGKIFLQLWHVGRNSHPFYLGGDIPVAPSAVPLSGRVSRSENLEYGEVRALENSEVYKLINAYIKGAQNALEAGFDGVEIHGANGYLVDQFLHQESNLRDDEFGGSAERRAFFALQIIDGIIEAITKERVGIRLSPAAYFNMSHTDGDEETFFYLLKELSMRKMAYVHTGIFDDKMKFDYLKGNVTNFLRKNFKGTVIACGSYDAREAKEAIEKSHADLIAIGRPLIANANYIEKISKGEILKEYDEGLLSVLE